MGVTLDEVLIGTRSQHVGPTSTLFYSVPTSAERLDRMRQLIASAKGYEPDVTALVQASCEEDEPAGVLGLPVDWETCGGGNLISMMFSNKSVEPVRLFGVLRGVSLP